MSVNNISRYSHHQVENKWREKWQKSGLYAPDIEKAKKPFFNLMMFPYMSAEGLHVGNAYAFIGADVYGRYQRMHGYDVLEPIGMDGFGIHTENYAIKVGRHPVEHARIAEKNYYSQLSMIGNGFDWGRRLETYDPDYYRWTQWLFIQMYKKGLVYKGKASVNWCPDCKTVLADEQVIDGRCERCKNQVKRREMSSWFFKITDYAERLLINIDGTGAGRNLRRQKIPLGKGYEPERDGLMWPETIKTAQRNWIGKKLGINIKYPLKGKKETITCFTTRPDTNFGATFVVVAPEYAKAKLLDLMAAKEKKTVTEYINKSLNKTEQQRLEEGGKKTGLFTGLYAVNELNGKEMPVWISDFVLSGFGTGAVVGVPGHDKRDFEFAREYDLPVARVVVGTDNDKSRITKIEQVQEKEGKMINSEFLDGLGIQQATKKMMDYIEEKGWGKRVVSYHLRDWLISRQRYWGPPIPMVHCQKCEWQPVDEKDLPIKLPNVKDFKPKGDGSSPLVNAPDAWKNTKCPKCKGKAERELDVSDTFLDSSWYFLAYPNLRTAEWKGKKSPFNREITEKWLPVDAYIGGAEHAVLHLLYSRFVTMVLSDLKYLSFEEPFPFLFGHGLIIKDGAKMSKSRGNVIIPNKYIDKYGADTLRAYLVFLGPYDAGGDFRDTGMEGMRRFLNRVWDLYARMGKFKALDPKESKKVAVKMHQTIKKVTEETENFRYNTALSAIMEYVNLLRKVAGKDSKKDPKTKKPKSKVKVVEWKEALMILSQLLAPFAPHLTEEAWVNVLGQKFSVHTSPWPEFNPDLVKEKKTTLAVQVNGKLRSTIVVGTRQAQEEKEMVKLAEADVRIQKWLSGKRIKKKIFVPGRLVNFVIS